MTAFLNEPFVRGIFPSYIYTYKNEGASWLDDDTVRDALGLEYKRNNINFISTDKYVLEQSVFTELKDTIQNILDDYSKHVLGFDLEQTRMDIKNSWLVVNGDNDGHMWHKHLNSFVSGVVYLRTGEDDSILFKNPSSELEQFNVGNTSDVCEHGVSNGDIILFASNLPHAVKAVPRSSKRISLGFNAFPVGSFGSDENITKLVL